MQGHALMPALDPLGLRVPLYFIYSDAAKDPDGSPWEFRGQIGNTVGSSDRQHIGDPTRMQPVPPIGY